MQKIDIDEKIVQEKLTEIEDLIKLKFSELNEFEALLLGDSLLHCLLQNKFKNIEDSINDSEGERLKVALCYSANKLSEIKDMVDEVSHKIRAAYFKDNYPEFPELSKEWEVKVKN